MAQPTKRLLVLAFGNPLCGDDAVAWHIAQALGDTLLDPAVEIEMCHQLTPELAEQVSQSDAVVFLDAAVGDSPGMIEVEDVEMATSDPTTWTHILTPALLLALSHSLYGRTPARSMLLRVGGGSFHFTDEMSAPVRRAVPKAVRKVVELVQSQEHAWQVGTSTSRVQ
jgi:hydrogenase maturation protease